MDQKTPQILISAGGVAVLAAIFALWCGGVRYSAAGMTAAVISAVLFTLVCLRFVPKWVDAWRDVEPDAPSLAATALNMFPRTSHIEMVFLLTEE